MNPKMIIEVVLFPGMVNVVEGVIVAVGPAAEPVQNVPTREALSNVKVLPFGPPKGFQVTSMLETVTTS